jgi:hypothetical protein
VTAIKSKGLLLFGAGALVVIVGLLAFGEQAQHGEYHLDGGRGWDLPSVTALDAGHVRLCHVMRPRIVITLEQREGATEAFVPALEVPLPRPAQSLAWFKWLPPPQA